VVQMSMCDEYRVESGQSLGNRGPVFFAAGFFSLKKAAINEDPFSMGGKNSPAPGDLTCSAEELQLKFVQMKTSNLIHPKGCNIFSAFFPY
jgi:hypothetical protein